MLLVFGGELSTGGPYTIAQAQRSHRVPIGVTALLTCHAAVTLSSNRSDCIADLSRSGHTKFQ